MRLVKKSHLGSVLSLMADYQTRADSSLETELLLLSEYRLQVGLMFGSVSGHLFFLDFHSGQLFGDFGKFTRDVIAVLFILMAVTGPMTWCRDPKTGFCTWLFPDGRDQK